MLKSQVKERKSGRLIGTADERWRGRNSWRLIWQDTRTRTIWQLKRCAQYLLEIKLTIVCYERECAKNKNLLEKKIIVANCLLERKITY